MLALQTWAALRASGIRTPEVAAWQRVPVAGKSFSASNRAGAIYPYVLNVYNAPAYSQVRLDLKLENHTLTSRSTHMYQSRCCDFTECPPLQIIMKDAITRKKMFFIPAVRLHSC